jgi:hypothetical protein
MADQTTQPSWLQRAMTFVALAALVAGHGYMTKQQPAAPVVITQPVEQVKVEPAKPINIDEARSYATKDGITLGDDDTKALIAVARLGDGRFVIASYPVGSKPVTKNVLVSGSELLLPVTPQQPGPDTRPDTEPVNPAIPGKKTAIYFYEKDQTAIPSFVRSALNKINRQGVDAVEYEIDTRGKNGEIQPRFKVAHERAVKEGVPVLIVMSGDTVAKVIKSPKSEDEMLGAIQ